MSVDFSTKRIFVAGKPLTAIWGPAELQWQQSLAEALPAPLRHPRLLFVRNDDSHVDLESLVYPVLVASHSLGCDSVWAHLFTGGGPTEGVWVSEKVPLPPPERPAAISVRIEQPSVRAAADRGLLPEVGGLEVVGRGRTLGLMLAFDSPDALSGGYEAAVKSLTEHLRPLLEKVPDVGRPTVAHHDRVRELRITQGHQPGGEGVVVTVWPLGHAFHNWRPHLFPPWRAWSSDRPRRGEFHCSVCGVRALCPNGCGALRAQWHDDEQGQSEMTWYCWRCESEWLDEGTFGECRRP